MRSTSMITRVAKCSAVGVAWLAIGAFADVPRVMTFQGKLADTQGRFVDGQRALTFRVYDRETSGAVLWQEQHAATTVTKGIFAVPLGVYQPLSLPFDTNYWISIEVGADGEMAPRQRLTASPYAFRAAESEHARTADHAATANSASNAVHATTADQATSVVNGGLPVGTVLPYASTNVPAGFLLCDGRSLSSFTYPALFSAIHTDWGVGDGSLDDYGRVRNFRLPDLRGRMIAGRDAGQAEFGTMGYAGGEKAHLLTVAEMPAHRHDMGTFQNSIDGPPYYPTGSGVVRNPQTYPMTGFSGGGQAHNNLPPYGVMNHIIKY